MSILDNTLIQELTTKNDFLELVAIQIHKDFSRAGIDLNKDSKLLKVSEVRDKIMLCLLHLNEVNPTQITHLLYIIDVSENKLKDLPKEIQKRKEQLATLIILRCAEKVWYRNNN